MKIYFLTNITNMNNEILLYIAATQQELENTKINIQSVDTAILIHNSQSNSWISNTTLWTKIPNTQKIYKLKILNDINTKNELYVTILNSSTGEVIKSKDFTIYTNAYYSQEYLAKTNENIQLQKGEEPIIHYTSPTANTGHIHSLLNTNFNTYLSLSIFLLAVVLGIISKKYKMLELIDAKYEQTVNKLDTYIDGMLCNIWDFFFTGNYSE